LFGDEPFCHVSHQERFPSFLEDMEQKIFADDVPLNTIELAQTMRVSRWTIGRWKKEQGYQFEFGRRTTAGHLKAWLRARATSDPLHGPEQKRLQSVLDRLR
jgi:hypothetical protein